jgi:hypothetical protein
MIGSDRFVVGPGPHPYRMWVVHRTFYGYYSSSQQAYTRNILDVHTQ